MAYRSMKKLIENINKQLNDGSMTREEYDLTADNYKNKLDVFLACNRLTSSQYEELTGMFVPKNTEEAVDNA